MKNFVLNTLLTLITSSSFTQNFKYEVKVDSTLVSGFHDILLNPEITSKLKSDFSDIRIFDEKKIEIPYIRRQEIPVSFTQLFKEYRILSNVSKKKCCTELLIENREKKSINNISLLIKNSDVQKNFKLSGSDDKDNWYVIKENYLFQSIYSNTETSEIKLMNFPLSNYAYFKIEIDDSASAPLKIIKAGYYDTESEEGKYSGIPLKEMILVNNEKDKKTYVRFILGSNQYIDKIELVIGGPTYYLRKADIAIKQKGSTETWEDNTEYEIIQSYELSSNSPNTIQLSKLKTGEFFLIIENDDNQPLIIKSVRLFQLNSYLTAHLEKGKHYSLKFGDANLAEPVYDLKYFENTIPENIPLLKTGELISLIKVEKTLNTSWLSNKVILWIVIGVVIVFMGILSVKMVRDMR